MDKTLKATARAMMASLRITRARDPKSRTGSKKATTLKLFHWIADETGVIVGRNPFGQKAIAWGRWQIDAGVQSSPWGIPLSAPMRLRGE